MVRGMNNLWFVLIVFWTGLVLDCVLSVSVSPLSFESRPRWVSKDENLDADFVSKEAYKERTTVKSGEHSSFWFCHGLECPQFTVDVGLTKKLRSVAPGREMEVRDYQEETWVVAEVCAAKICYEVF